MNDETLEQYLREMPAPELPAAWRGEILATALRAAPWEASSRAVLWPEVLVYLRRLCARNPITAGALATLWMLILFLRLDTPVDPAERQIMAHYDPKRPIYIVSVRDEIKLVEFLQESPTRPLERMP